jgi:hypothetical protein
MPAIAAIDNETLDHLLSVVDDARNLTGVRALSKPGPRDQRWDARVAGEMRVCAPNRGRPDAQPVAWRKRRSGLAGVGGLERGSRLLLGLVGGTVAHQSHLVRCRLLARDAALLVTGALDDLVLGRECRRGDDQRKGRDSQFEFHDLVFFGVAPHNANRPCRIGRRSARPRFF